ncbi:hypothetical protein [Saprospira grandis]|uniref:hypothetical protein n=1 Tax=Saprospira grandis TaxID=1008 RepID=UPI0022DE1BC3|nr:hypothetical protein [Saprospira grandis]WBM74068.1 hypothetical protein OP864_13855 [Saprospira grandis]
MSGRPCCLLEGNSSAVVGLFLFMNSLLILNNPSFFKNDLEKVSLEYLFLPGKKGGDAKKAAKNAKEKILEFIENNITEQKQKDLFMDNLEVKYVDKDGLLKIF